LGFGHSHTGHDMTKTITDVACTVCGCVCDDLAITVENGQIVKAERACALAEKWYAEQNRSPQPDAELNGKPAKADEAYARAVQILSEARYPLIYGLSRSTTEGQRAATALADRIGGTIDTTASTGHAPSIMALQQVGESTCTLGEVKNRADLVIFWGSDPIYTHPRHLERYSADAAGRWVPGGRKDRYVVVVDERETESAKFADEFIPVEAGKHWEALWNLRLLIRGLTSPPVATGGSWLDLANRMKSCRCGVIFFGNGITKEPLAHRAVEAMLQLVTDLNAHTRFYARRMRRYGDVAGADSVLAWQTGYPFGVNLSRGYPRYNPGEFTGPEMLERGEVDACVLIGSETIADFSDAALERLRNIPVILLDSPGLTCKVPAAVKFTTAVYGVHKTGTAYRMDEVPIPLRVIVPKTYSSDGDVLGEILKRLGSA
jgi:formylmethanofuran dehydrogenase subunit B